MPNNTEKGNFGEKLALDFLRSKGYSILDCNWRFRHLEIDIVASFNNYLVIVEVKMRSNNEFGNPEGFVTRTKQKNLVTAAHQYIILNNIDLEARFDIISITESPQLKIEHIKDAFSAGL